VINDSIISPKLALVFGPWQKTEYYVNAGNGFHSNDARGTTIRTDPVSGLPADRVPGLVRSTGYELGMRSEWLPGLQSTLAVFQLDFASELIFIGDAGTTEAGRPSRRIGWEFNNYYKPTSWLTIDADLAMTRARFRDVAAEGSRVPGAVEGVASLAAIVDNNGAAYGSMQLRYFGPRPLVEDNSVRSNATMSLNGRLGYRLNKDTRLELMGFNLTNRQDPAIQYYYASRLASEPAGSATPDIHFHPVEPRSFRVALITRF
jgi:outer membrane receptor protein involved in Fe transport